MLRLRSRWAWQTLGLLALAGSLVALAVVAPRPPINPLPSSRSHAAAPQPVQADPSYSTLVHAMERDEVRSVVVDSTTGHAQIELSNGFKGTAILPLGDSTILRQLTDHGAAVRVVEPSHGGVGAVLGLVMPLLLVGGLVFAVIVMRRQRRSAPFGAGAPDMSLRASVAVADVPRERFTDVAGCDEAVEELSEIVQFFRDPTRFAHLGAPPRLPHPEVRLPGWSSCGTRSVQEVARKPPGRRFEVGTHPQFSCPRLPAVAAANPW